MRHALPLGAGSPAFRESYPEVFRRTLTDAAERLRANLELALNNVIPPAKVTWQKALRDVRPLAYESVKFGLTFILGAASGMLAGHFHIPH